MFEDNITFSVIDTETTSTGDHTVNKICEIAIINTANRQITDEFSSLVKPSVRISDDATRIHHITNDDVASAPPFHKVSDRIYELIKGSILVCHNTAFDVPIIMMEFMEASKPLFMDITSIDTVKLSRCAFPGLPSYRLVALTGTLGIPVERSHRAYDDCRATVELLWQCIDRLKEKGVTEMSEILKMGRNKKLNSILRQAHS